MCLSLLSHEWVGLEYISRYSDGIGAGRPGKGLDLGHNHPHIPWMLFPWG
jgi:hypothetical protein